MHDDLLTDALLPIFCGEDEVKLSLPAVFARLSTETTAGPDCIDSFSGLAAHQRQAWFHFLVQLGTIALGKAGLSEPPTDEFAWRRLLSALTGSDSRTAWSLVVNDAAKPAFMQPPATEASVGRMKLLARTPDKLDMLVTGRNYELKAFRLVAAEPHLWIYALVSLQTMQGYSGGGLHGIARMNTGTGSRVLFELVPSMDWGVRFRHGLKIALAHRPVIRRDFGLNGDLALLWLAPWDTEASLYLQDLDPYFIEICRRIRLVGTPDGRPGARIVAIGRASRVRRVDAAARKGVLGDPWTPIVHTEEGDKALTPPPSGLGYKLLARILFADNSSLPAALTYVPNGAAADNSEPGEGEGSTGQACFSEMLLHVSVLLRGQGRTEGLHDRVIAVRPSMRAGLGAASGRTLLGAVASDMIADIDKGAIRPLKIALLTLLQGPSDGQVDFQDRRADRWVARLDREVDAIFFDWLQTIYDADGATARAESRTNWRHALRMTVSRIFEDAAGRLKAPGSRRDLARATAELVFQGMLVRVLFPRDEAEEVAA